MPTILGQNQYGKAENRVVKITRDGATHHIKDLNVSVSLSGDMEEVHYSGSNANVLPTDTTKNTVYAFAKEHGIESAEQFGIHLARHFVTSQEPIHRARIRIEEYAWERIEASDANSRFIGADEVKHSFVRKGQETRLTQITYDGSSWEVISGLKDLVVMNSTNSEFWGYVKDKYTTLKEAYDRILATQARPLAVQLDRRRPAHAQVGEVLRADEEAHAPGLRRDVLALAPADDVPDGRADHRQPQRDRRGPLLPPEQAPLPGRPGAVRAEERQRGVLRRRPPLRPDRGDDPAGRLRGESPWT
ncbi:hypothetical protein SVIOM74S_03604 [Streptomyces violarus]